MADESKSLRLDILRLTKRRVKEGKLKPDVAHRIREAVPTASKKRALKIVLALLEKGEITTREITALGYEHPPRAAQDVKDYGIPLDSEIRYSPKRYAIYRFGDVARTASGKSRGRMLIPKSVKLELLDLQASKCAICCGEYTDRTLQADHRVPYEICGDSAGRIIADELMLLCPSCNRGKSWDCEHCPNWSIKDPETCRTCLWSGEKDYSHVGTLLERRLTVVMRGKAGVAAYTRVVARAGRLKQTVNEFVCNLLILFAKK